MAVSEVSELLRPQQHDQEIDGDAEREHRGENGFEHGAPQIRLSQRP
jgi:hypothetical protein